MAAPSALLGQAGEHHVMAQLLRRGMIAALAPAGVPNADILVTDDVGDRLCAIQVKSRLDKGSDGGWHMRAKHEKIAGPYLFYAFVDFGSGLEFAARTFIIPAAVVANVIRTSHQAWLAKPGQHGRQRNDSDFRRLLPDYARQGLSIGYDAGWMTPYDGAWNSLLLPSSS